MNLVSGLKLTACLLVAVTATLVAQHPSDPTELLAKARGIIVARSKSLSGSGLWNRDVGYLFGDIFESGAATYNYMGEEGWVKKEPPQ